jgi:hypothetical protein
LYRDSKSIINNVMQRSAWFALLTAAILVAVPLHAQRGGGGFHGGGPGLGAGHAGFTGGSFSRYPGYHRRFRNYGFGFASWYYPDWDGDEPLEFYPETAMNVPAPPGTAPPVIVVERQDSRPPAPAPEGPRLIEVPQTKGIATTPKPEPPTLFVFASGERLEARRYMLTADSLRVEIGRQERRISLGEIDIDATIAANHERGIDLRIPTGRSEIFLGF